MSDPNGRVGLVKRKKTGARSNAGDLRANIRRVAEIVSTWPEWKRGGSAAREKERTAPRSCRNVILDVPST